MRILEQHIAVNRLQCKKCKDIITSRHGHDFVTCECKSISADGGGEYLRRCGDLDGYIDLSEYGYREREVNTFSEDMYRHMAEEGLIKIIEDDKEKEY